MGLHLIGMYFVGVAIAEKAVVEYLHRVQAVVWMRRLMLTTE
jgi:hypothetical protein